MKKGFSLDYLAVIVLIVTILVLVSVATVAAKGSLTQTKNLAVEYAALKADIVMQGVIQGFENTALFFGVMNAANELGAHGGVSSDALSLPEDVYSPWMQSDSDTLYWAVARCDNEGGQPTSRIAKRPPFVFYNEQLYNLMNIVTVREYGNYDIDINSAKNTFPIIDHTSYAENMDDVKDGKYSFHAVVQIFVYEQSTVHVEIYQATCGDACKVSETITESGFVALDIGSNVVRNADEDVLLSVWSS